MDESELDEHKAWSSVAGERMALQRVAIYLSAEVGQLFASGKDREAIALREYLRTIQEWEKDSSKRLQVFINRSHS